MLQHIQANDRVEAPGQGWIIHIPIAAQLGAQAQLGSASLHKGAIVGIEIHKPHPLHLGKSRRGQGMAADAAAEVEHLTAGKALLQPQGVSDVVGAA